MNTLDDGYSPRVTQAQADEARADLVRMAQEREAQQVESLGRLRALRVWHWRSLLRFRNLARQAVNSDDVRRYNAEADTHLGFVQSLNDFFEVGDTAERDAAK
jgi:hypothetical protein